MSNWRSSACLFLVILVTTLAGCTGKSEPTSFFMLRSLEEYPGPRPTGPDISVLVGPITVSAYLDRSQIVARQEGVEVIVHDFDHWAEPLDRNMKRVLMANLSTLLGSAEVYDFENSRSPDTDFQLQVEVDRFDFTRNGTAILTAFWTVYDAKGDIISRNRTVMTAEAGGKGLASMVAAQNTLVTNFSKKVVDELLSQGSKPRLPQRESPSYQ